MNTGAHGVFAILETRCGCQRGMTVANPPPKEIRIALKSDYTYTPEEDVELSAVTTHTRVFKLKRMDTRSVAYYFEVESNGH